MVGFWKKSLNTNGIDKLLAEARLADALDKTIEIAKTNNYRFALKMLKSLSLRHHQLTQSRLLLEPSDFARRERVIINDLQTIIKNVLTLPFIVATFLGLTITSILCVIALLIPIISPDSGLKIQPYPEIEGNKAIFSIHKIGEEDIENTLFSFKLEDTSKLKLKPDPGLIMYNDNITWTRDHVRTRRSWDCDDTVEQCTKLKKIKKSGCYKIEVIFEQPIVLSSKEFVEKNGQLSYGVSNCCAANQNMTSNSNLVEYYSFSDHLYLKRTQNILLLWLFLTCLISLFFYKHYIYLINFLKNKSYVLR